MVNSRGVPKGFQDVVFMPSTASVSTTFFKNCLGQSYVLRLVVGVGKGMPNVKYFHSIKASFFSVEFRGDHKTVTKLR